MRAAFEKTLASMGTEYEVRPFALPFPLCLLSLTIGRCIKSSMRHYSAMAKEHTTYGVVLELNSASATCSATTAIFFSTTSLYYDVLAQEILRILTSCT